MATTIANQAQGALAHAQLERWTVTYDAVVRGELLTKALALWHAGAKSGGQLIPLARLGR